jgi:hypothetical protein
MSIKRTALIILGTLLLGGGTILWQARTANKLSSPIAYSLHIQNKLDTAPISPKTGSVLRFDIRAQNGQVFKDFDQQQPNPLALIVIRKDRTNFQHIYPIYNELTGTFTVPDFKMDADGPYRLFAAFTPEDTRVDSLGSKEMLTPYADITVGDISRYIAQDPGPEKLTSNADGYLMQLFAMSSTAAKQPATPFLAGSSRIVGVSLTKDGTSVKNLEHYRGSLARMVVIGPNLEIVSVNSVPSDPSESADPIAFRLTLPTVGDYKFFVQVEADESIQTFDFEASVHN